MLIVDRILNDYAVCADRGFVINIPLSDISGSVREGDILGWDEFKSKYVVDINGTKERFDIISERFLRIKNRGRGQV